MARQSPKCCGCVPLRPGLLAWAYIKLVLALAYIGWCVFITTYFMDVEHFNNIISHDRSPAVFILEQFWAQGASLLYLIFSIIFAIGVHRQSSKLLLVFLVYSFFEVMGAVAFIGWKVYEMVSIFYDYGSESLQSDTLVPAFYLPFIALVVLNMLLPIYFIVLIKSEVQRLKTAVTKEQDKTYNLGYSNETAVSGESLFPVEELQRLRQQLGVRNV